MQISSNYNTPNITPIKNSHLRANKNPNFKALIMEPQLSHEVKWGYIPLLEKFATLKDKLTGFKHWDLKIISLCSAPYFILQSKTHKNQYVAFPDSIGDARPGCVPSAAIEQPISMRIAKDAKKPLFKKDIISPFDESIEQQKQNVVLTYASKEEATEKGTELSRIRDRYDNALSNGVIDSYFIDSYYDYALYMLSEFERMSEKKSTTDEEFAELQKQKEEENKANKGKTTSATGTNESGKESYIVKKADKEVVAGTKEGEVKTGFAKVAGMDELKETLREDVILPLQQIELYKKYGLAPSNGIILYGPPGTGKTYIAEALAEESGRTFLRMDVSDVESKYVGDTPKNIAKVFQEAEENAPSIIFIDELEALAPSRSQLEGSSSAAIGYNQAVNTLLQNLNNCTDRGIFVIAATNEPQKIDSAIKRAGRIDKTIFVPPPDFSSRKELFRMSLEDIYTDGQINYENLANLTENYTAPEIKQILIREAAKIALKQNRPITEADIIEQINKYKPQLNKSTIESYRRKGIIDKKEATSLPKIGFK